MESRSGSKLDHVGSKTRLQGQIIEKPCLGIIVRFYQLRIKMMMKLEVHKEKLHH